MVEIASNRGETTLSFDGDYTTDWPDGQNYPDDYVRLPPLAWSSFLLSSAAPNIALH